MLKEMKTLSILFSEPNVFSVLPEWPDEKHCKEYKCWHNPDRVKQCGCGLYNEYDAACEQSKANAIRIANPEILPLLKRYSDKKSYFKIKEDSEYLKHGDIFQVEGFEYEVTRDFNAMCDELCEHCKYHDLECSKITKVSCVLKLAKEEEPKEQIGFTIEEIEFIKEDERNKIVNSTIKSVLKILRKEGITKEFKEYKQIESLKKS